MYSRTMLLEERDSLLRQLQQYRKALFRLQEQKAKYGLGVPLEILNNLDEAQENIEAVEIRLQEILAQLENLPPESESAVDISPAPVTAETGFAYSASLSSSVTPSVSEPELLPLKEAFERRSLALFIGSDLPGQITGIPSRAELARQLAQRKGLDLSLSLAEVTQQVSQAGSRFEFTDFLRSVLDVTDRSLPTFYEQLARLVKSGQIMTVITITYDNLLELALQQAQVRFNRVVQDSDVNFINPDRLTLIKLYGDLQQPDTLVVTDQDHSGLLRNPKKKDVLDEIKRTFRQNTVLFVGYNLMDADFRFLFDQIAESRFARQAYALWPGLLSSGEVQMWRQRGIIILPADAMAVLTGLLPAT